METLPPKRVWIVLCKRFSSPPLPTVWPDGNRVLMTFQAGSQTCGQVVAVGAYLATLLMTSKNTS